jgi:hypothetical protein
MRPSPEWLAVAREMARGMDGGWLDALLDAYTALLAERDALEAQASMQAHSFNMMVEALKEREAERNHYIAEFDNASFRAEQAEAQVAALGRDLATCGDPECKRVVCRLVALLADMERGVKP